MDTIEILDPRRVRDISPWSGQCDQESRLVKFTPRGLRPRMRDEKLTVNGSGNEVSTGSKSKHLKSEYRSQTNMLPFIPKCYLGITRIALYRIRYAPASFQTRHRETPHP